MRKNQFGFADVAFIVILFVVLIVGVGAYVLTHKANKNTNNSANTVTNEAGVSLNKALPANLLSLDKIAEAAEKESPGASVTGIKLGIKNNTYVYKVYLEDKTEMQLNAQTGAVLASAKVDELDSDEPIAANLGAVGFDKAREVALKEKPGGTIFMIKLELDEGEAIYYVHFSDQTRVNIDAIEGTVLNVREPEAF